MIASLQGERQVSAGRPENQVNDFARRLSVERNAVDSYHLVALKHLLRLISWAVWQQRRHDVLSLVISELDTDANMAGGGRCTHTASLYDHLAPPRFHSVRSVVFSVWARLP